MRYPSTDDWIVGFKIGPLTKRLVDLVEDNDVEITSKGNRVLLSVRFVDIMQDDISVLYADFTKKWMDKKGQKGAPGLDAMKARAAEHKAKRGVKEEVVTELNRYGKETGKATGSINKRAGTPVK